MGIINETIRSATRENPHPLLDAAACLNRKQNKFTCTVCTDICPEQVFSLNANEKPKWEKCMDCSLCLSACPSRCFTPSDAMQSTLTEEIHMDERVLFACEQEAELCERKVHCLGSLPWEMLAVLALTSGLALVDGYCAACSKTRERELLQANLAQLEQFLGEERFRERVQLLGSAAEDNAAPPEEKQLSRRALFSGAKKNLKKSLYKAAAQRLPQLEAKERDGIQFRRLLSSAVLREREMVRKAQAEAETEAEQPQLPRFAVSLPAYQPACYGCSICERVCPQNAISIQAEESGTRLIYITPWKCTGCGLCAEICPWEGLAGIKPVSVPYLEQLPLTRVASMVCAECGVAVRPGTVPPLCPSCNLKAKRKKRITPG